jgi:hypothetical protein
MIHTLSSLESLPDRDLDTIVGDIVFRGNPPRLMGWAPAAPMEKPIALFSSDWSAFGLVVERMREHGFGPQILWRFEDHRHEVGFYHIANHWWSYAFAPKPDGIPRAAAIAAIVAVQGRG